MRRVIEFATQAEMESARRLFPVSKPLTKSIYDDLILKPEYQSRRYTFPTGTTCIRILPPIKGSFTWEHVIHVLTHPTGQHAHPKCLEPKTKSVFDIAYSWLRANKPSQLYSKANRDGYRLLSSKMAACWILVEINGEMQAKLLLGSTYDGGSQGSNCGLAHQLQKVAREISQPGGHDAVDAAHGVQIIVEKSTPHGTKYPSYKMTRSHMAAPVCRYLERMKDAELAALCPLPEVLRHVGQEEEWELLAKVVGEELRDKIRNSTTQPLQPQPPSPPSPAPQPETQPETQPESQSQTESEVSDDPWIW